MFGRNRTGDIQQPDWNAPRWDPQNVEASLAALRAYAEAQAKAAIAWYYKNKRPKAWASQYLRAFIIVATAAGGLIPVLVAAGLFNRTGAVDPLRNAQINQYGFVALGLAGLALAFDRFFGASSSWMRYISAAMSLETALEQFRFDWVTLTIPLDDKLPEGTELEDLVKRVSDFVFVVRTVVENETKQWMTEFQSNLAELEKQTKAALETARAESERMQKEATSLRDSQQPGAIDLTVDGGDAADNGYDIFLDEGFFKHAIGKTCALAKIGRGLHHLRLVGKIAGEDALVEQNVIVQPNAITKQSMTLAKVKTVGAKT
jgi:hypothetical protein